MPAVAAHVVDIYRRTEDGAGWNLVAAAVSCDLQPLGGDVKQEPYGRVAERKRRGFFTTGLDLRADDGVTVTAGPGGAGNWLVQDADDWGSPGDLECMLVETHEEFDAEEPG